MAPLDTTQDNTPPPPDRMPEVKAAMAAPAPATPKRITEPSSGGFDVGKVLADYMTSRQRHATQADEAQLSYQAAQKKADELQQPKQQETPAMERWGSMAMAVAALGGLLTHTPLTTALNAAAGVNKAYNEGDLERYREGMAQFKASHDAALKSAEMAYKDYDAAIKRLSSDSGALRADLMARTAAYGDMYANKLLQEGKTDEALAVLAGGGRAIRGLKAAGDKTGDDAAALEYVLATHPEATPLQRDLAKKAIHAGKDPEETVFGTEHKGDLAPQPVEVVAADGTKKTIPAVYNKIRGTWTDTTTGQVLDASSGTLRQISRTSDRPISAAQASEQRAETLGHDAFVKREGREPDPNNPADKAKLAADVNAAVTTQKLAQSPFMQGLGPKEREAVERAIKADPTIENDPKRMGALINQVTGRTEQKETLTGKQIEDIDVHAGRVAHLLDDIEKMQDLMSNPAIATKLGRPLRAGEAIGNIIGAMDDSDRAQFDQLLARVRQEGPKLMSEKITPSETKPDPTVASALFAAQRWGDTKQGVEAILNDWHDRFVSDISLYNQMVPNGLTILGRGKSTPKPQVKDAAQPGEQIFTDAKGNKAVKRNGAWVEVQ